MITTVELDELKAMSQRMAVLLARVEAVEPICRTCGNGKGGFCSVYQMDIPADSMTATCEKWCWDDIPF